MMGSAVVISDVHKAYGNTKALRGVNLTIQEGEILGLLGPNGAGKTTLISAMAGLNRPDRGRITVMGHDVRDAYRAARRCIGVVPQELVFDPFFSVRETLRLQSGYFGIRRNDAWIDEILDNLDLTDKADCNMRALSGGMKRRVLVAQALVHRPPVIVLDEPTAGVDVELRQSLWQFIRRLNAAGHTIVLTTHYLDEAESLCARIGMMKSGKLLALDTTASLLKQQSAKVLRVKTAARGLADGMESSSEQFSWVEMPFTEYSEVEWHLAHLREQGLEVIDMEMAKPDLEDVFIRFMGLSVASE